MAILPLAVACCRKEEKSPPAPVLAQAAPVLAAPAPEPPPRLKIATVDMQQVFTEFHRTISLQTEQNLEVAKVQKESEERLVRIRGLQAEIEDLTKQLADPTISDSRKQQLAASRESKAQDGIAHERERREFLQRRRIVLQERAAQGGRAALEEIRLQVVERAKADGVDYVFDKSASSALQTPFFIHTPDASDLTDQILARLNRDAPSPEDNTRNPNSAPVGSHD